MADLVKPGSNSNESLQQTSCKGKSKIQSKQKKTTKLILKKPRKLATDAQLKALDDVISEVASQQELDSSYNDADDDSSGEKSQFVNCKNKLKCACCEEVCHLQHKIREYSLKVDNQQSEIMYVKSRVKARSHWWNRDETVMKQWWNWLNQHETGWIRTMKQWWNMLIQDDSAMKQFVL